MIRAIVFDCFGVLAEDGWLPFKRKYVRENAQLIEQLADLGKQNEYGLISNDEYFSRAAQAVEVQEEVLRAAVNRRVPNEELFEFIVKTLKSRYKIGLLSNANYDVVHELFTKEQSQVFDAAVLSFESKLVKPDSRMFELMVARLGVELDECLFVDDVERYCVAAESIGMKSILYQDLNQCITDIGQLLDH